MTKIKKSEGALALQQQMSKEIFSSYLSKNEFADLINEYGEFFKRKLFVNCFGYYPNLIELNKIQVSKAYSAFCKQYEKEIKHHHSEVKLKSLKRISKNNSLEEAFCLLYEDTMVSFVNVEDGFHRINIWYNKTDFLKIESLITYFFQFSPSKKKKKSKIYLMSRGHFGLTAKSMNLETPKLDVESNYNDDFMPVHEKIFTRLNTENEKGLVILHGKPGTGKSSYIRFLSAKLNKKIIFLPSDIGNQIANPDFMTFLIENQNSILVIEDAEKVIVARENNEHSPVSSLLNLTDGLLADCLNIQVICSFNVDLSQIDKALLRKGRLIARYNFKELDMKKAQALSDKLGFDRKITEPTLLTDIYNFEEKLYGQEPKKSRIGFNFEKTT